MQRVQQQSMFVLTVLIVAIIGPAGWILANWTIIKAVADADKTVFQLSK